MPLCCHGLHHKGEVTVDEPGWHSMANVSGGHGAGDVQGRAIASEGGFQGQTPAQHRQITTGCPMRAERLGIAFHATPAWRDIRHLAGGCHVARLALLPPALGRTGEPFRVGGVDFGSEDRPLMARGAVPALLVQGGVGILVPVHIIQGTEEQLPC